MDFQKLIPVTETQSKLGRIGGWPALPAIFLILMLSSLPTSGGAVPCELPDNGTGTVDLPPEGCAYLSPDEVHMIIDGLPPGTTIEMAPAHAQFFNINRTPGGTLGGEIETFESYLDLQMTGTGDLEGFTHSVSLPISCEVHTGPRNPGDPVQEVEVVMMRLEGGIYGPGDAHFGSLQFRAGDAFGYPSPGHTTITELGGGLYNIDSFFDITYQVSFVGSPTGALAGMGGTTVGTLRMETGEQVGETGACCYGDGSCDETLESECYGAIWFAGEVCDPNPCQPPETDCNDPGNGAGTVDLPPENCPYLSPDEVHMIIEGLPPGTTIELAPIHQDFWNIDRTPGGTLGGEIEDFDSHLFLVMRGTGDLDGYVRELWFDLACQVHTGPRNPGDPVQSFANDMYRLSGGIVPSDNHPEFARLEVLGGTDFGLPGPGHTTITELPSGEYNIDSFFDITYRIDFEGAPGSQLEGYSGVTTATLRMETGETIPEPTGACCYLDGSCLVIEFSNCHTGDFRAYEVCDPNPCPQPETGACCFPTGMCVETFELNCPTGDWSAGVSCSPNPCPQPPEDCEEPDNGTGTVNLPPENCQYLSPQEVHMIIEGLPPGTTIELDPIHDRFINVDRTPGGTLGGEIEVFDSNLQLSLRGTGDLDGFLRVIEVPLACEVHTGPRNPGDPVQDFPNDMMRLEGSLAGDPDFAVLDIIGGTFNGLPSPGQTVVTDLGGGLYNIDSFFDISYQIDFNGAPGGALDGLSGSTVGTLRMETGETVQEPDGACCYLDGSCLVLPFSSCHTGDFRPYEGCDPNPCPQPETGACCFPTGMCVETTEANCPTGDWMGMIPCDPNPCPEPPDDCEVPDNGEGTVNLPPDGCAYLSPEDVHLIIEGLPPGTTIELDPIHDRFINIDRQPGGTLGGEIEYFDSDLQLSVVGTGDLDGFLRQLTVPVVCEVHTGPRNPGDAVQQFDNEMMRLTGSLSGDPDFDQLIITAGTEFSYHSPGQTTLTQLPTGDFNVDSFFDISYRIDFVGAPGGALEGLSGSTNGVLIMDTGQTIPEPMGACCYPNGACVQSIFSDCPTGDFRAYEVCTPNPCPQPEMGACCLPSGKCVQTLENSCPSGDWRLGEPCEPNPCPQPPEECEEPDNGSGTVNLPPESCGYLSPEDVHIMIEGLPPGTTIELDPIHDRFIQVDRIPGGTLGGEVEIFDSNLQLAVRGTGDLDGFTRMIDISLDCEVHTGPREPGEAVQEFPNDMFRLQGLISGDPDFETLMITAGTDFGLPSPGQTTLTQLPTGDFNVDSFFDITYQIDFVGAPGSQLDGMSGTTTATIRMETGHEVPPPPGACCYPNGDCVQTTWDSCPTDDFRAYEVCDPNPCPQPTGDCLEPDNGSGTVNLPPENCAYISPEDVHLIIEGLPPGTTIELDPIHDRFIDVQRQLGGSLGGEVETFNSSLTLEATGTGDLAGFNRTLTLELACETHTGPRTPGDSVQSFPTKMFRLQGGIVGDPDFEELIITAGDDFGMPSPGHTILIDQGDRGDFMVDSFFDITYRIDFIGAIGSQLEGLSGSTMGTIWMGVGSLNIPEDVEEIEPVLRGQIRAHPNPFFNTTTIAFTLESAGSVELQIFDVSGRMVRSLANTSLSAGTHQLNWDGRDDSGTSLRSGVYFYQLRVDGKMFGSKRTLLLK